MNYKIITDENELRKFINWLPELEQGEKYYCSLFARKKYCNEPFLKSDKSQIKRFTSNKEFLYDKIKQLECEVGSYKYNGHSIPQESLALYINPNPRSMVRATYKLIKACVDLIDKNNGNFNVHAEALSAIQKSRSKSHFCDFDIDTKDIDLTVMREILPDNTYDILETRGGYHILIKTRLAPKTKWHMLIREKFNIDQVGDQLIPIVGCYQGGFTPKFINL